MSGDHDWPVILSSLASFQVAFIGLKLTNQLHWSWWAVMFPLWGPGGVLAAMLAILLLVCWFADSVDQASYRAAARKRRQ